MTLTRVGRVFVCVAIIILLSQFLDAQSINIGLERARAKTILTVVSKRIQKDFYDPDLRGLQWQQLLAETQSRIDAAQSPGQMYTAIFALIDKLQDSHTVFIPPGHVNKPKFGFEAQPFGDEVRIYELEKDSVVKAAGLELGDQILSINGYVARREDFDKLILFLRVLRPVAAMEINYRRGTEGEKNVRVQGKVQQGVQVKDLNEDAWYDFIREDQTYEAKHPHVKWADYGDGIGYLKLRSFEPEEGWLHDALGKVQDSKALIFDLRGNGGGRVDSLKYVAGCFSTQPWVMANSLSRKKLEPIKVEPKSPHLMGPLVVLIDSESASAAEAFARSMQISNRARIVGDRSLGRLTVAKIFPEKIGADIIVPFATEVGVAHFIFTTGEEVEGKGVIPDEVCIPSGQDLKENRDPCRDRAVALLRMALQLPEVTNPKPRKEGKMTWE